MEWCHLQWVALTTSITIIRVIPHKHAQRLISQIILDSIKLTKDINRQAEQVSLYQKQATETENNYCAFMTAMAMPYPRR